jgi:hypothetical protein
VELFRHFFKNPAVPEEYRQNFIHLYFDIAWFGILSGSAINFLNIYAARLGASAFQIGLLGAMPAVVSLFLSIPTGSWLQNQPVGKVSFGPHSFPVWGIFYGFHYPGFSAIRVKFGRSLSLPS